ncbi:MAG: hypothetical protein N2648_01185 [Aquificaceae bacterium]|nr:hypothetical protein [Aquificaceae bacterium]MCS7195914.1 hypothetical protein [Aquificaceae bacterium]MCX7989241.1 hypothetical protein [Aquificaceae bacterium]MDW8033003.1 hypothetical protein [Aquificaceae bacterium]MDW8294380.1 hypothetical protein [Aquificaceae bacterium]
MSKAFFSLALLFLTGCEALRLQNPCSSKIAEERVRLGVAIHSWYMDNPTGATLEIGLKGIETLFLGASQEGVEAWLYERLKDRIERTRILDISTPQKIDAHTYRCSAITELKGRRYGVVYTMEKVHSGREDYYKIEVQEVLEVK